MLPNIRYRKLTIACCKFIMYVYTTSLLLFALCCVVCLQAQDSGVTGKEQGHEAVLAFELLERHKGNACQEMELG